jgi:hypothetical protein
VTRWRWRKRDVQDPGATSPDEAVEISRRQKAEAKAEGTALHAKAAYFREVRERNHFAEAIAHALREGR